MEQDRLKVIPHVANEVSVECNGMAVYIRDIGDAKNPRFEIGFNEGFYMKPCSYHKNCWKLEKRDLTKDKV